MSKIEELAVKAYEANKKLPKKYQTPDDAYIDWFKKGADTVLNDINGVVLSQMAEDKNCIIYIVSQDVDDKDLYPINVYAPKRQITEKFAKKIKQTISKIERSLRF